MTLDSGNSSLQRQTIIISSRNAGIEIARQPWRWTRLTNSILRRETIVNTFYAIFSLLRNVRLLESYRCEFDDCYLLKPWKKHYNYLVLPSLETPKSCPLLECPADCVQEIAPDGCAIDCACPPSCEVRKVANAKSKIARNIIKFMFSSSVAPS